VGSGGDCGWRGGEITMPLSESDIEQIAEAMVKKLKESHACRFSDVEAGRMHSFARASDRAEADEGTYVLVLQVGRDAQNVIRRGVQAAVLVIIAIALFFMGKMALANWK
jgi:hypothetical protein